MAVEGTQAETVAHDKHADAENGMTKFVRYSSFLFLSVLFHIVILLLLTLLPGQERQLPQHDIAIQIKEIQAVDTPQPLRKRQGISGENALDIFAVATINAIANGETLVVLMGSSNWGKLVNFVRR